MQQATMTELVADRVRRLRMGLRWSAQRLADECARAGGDSLTRGTIAKIESGARKSVTADEVVVLARVLGVTPTDLLTPKYRTIVVVDITSFTNPVRTLLDQRIVREGLHRVLRAALSDIGVKLSACTIEDRGDGKLILMPPGVDNTRVADQLPGRLLAWLRRHNKVHSPAAQVKLRVALHKGEVQQDEHGILSQAVNLTFRIVDAPDAKTMLRSTACILALIASDEFYRAEIARDPAADPGAYRQITVPGKETSAVAWLRIPDRPSPDPALDHLMPDHPAADGEIARQADYPPVLELLPAAERERLYEWLGTLTVPNLRTLVARAAGPGRHPDPESLADIWEAFCYMEELNAAPDGLPPALLFVELIAGEEAAHEVSAKLREWNDDQAQRLRLEPQLRKRRDAMSPIPPRSLLHLMIVVEPDGIDPGLYRVSHWRQDDATVWPPARGETRVVTSDDLERCVDDLVVSAERAWSGHIGSVALEFVLPRALLSMPVHRWRKEHASGDPRPLCLDYPIMVRSLERMQSPHWHRVWHQRWNILMNDRSEARVHYAQVADTAEPHRIDAILSDLRYVLMVLTAAPAPQPQPGADELTAALRSGLPALLWHPEASSEVLRDAVTRLAADDNLADLPGWSQKSRRAAFRESTTPGDDIIRDLVVLWDDPDRLVVLDQPPDQPPPEKDIADEHRRVPQRITR